jgi:hypothetical protein
MRRKYTFLLTILPTEEDQEDLCGRLQLVQSNRADNFTSLKELRDLINQVLLSNPIDACEFTNSSLPSTLSSPNGKALEST